MRASPKCRDYIRFKEKLELKAYRDSKNVLTIGWGHTGPDVYEGLVIDLQQAQELFEQDILEAEDEVHRRVKVQITQSMFDCLVSFEFNTGGLVFLDRHRQEVKSRLLQALNSRRWNDAIEELVMWNMTGGEDSRGLLIRRLEEALMFTRERYPA